MCVGVSWKHCHVKTYNNNGEDNLVFQMRCLPQRFEGAQRWQYLLSSTSPDCSVLRHQLAPEKTNLQDALLPFIIFNLNHVHIYLSMTSLQLFASCTSFYLSNDSIYIRCRKGKGIRVMSNFWYGFTVFDLLCKDLPVRLLMRVIAIGVVPVAGGVGLRALAVSRLGTASVAFVHLTEHRCAPARVAHQHSCYGPGS